MCGLSFAAAQQPLEWHPTARDESSMGRERCCNCSAMWCNRCSHQDRQHCEKPEGTEALTRGSRSVVCSP